MNTIVSRERAGQRKDSSSELLAPRARTASPRRNHKISVFGNFGLGNIGNESTFEAILYHLRRLVPGAEVICICTGPEAIAASHGIRAVPSCRKVVTTWTPSSRLARLLRRVFVGIPSEVYRWAEAFRTLKGTDALIVPGTGLLTDAYGLMNNWGPYSVFKWSLVAKLCGCKLFFVSVGAGPLYSRLGRVFAKSALAIADYRSYRDTSSLDYLKSIGFVRKDDRVYPDLVFSLPESVIPHGPIKKNGRSVVGLGLMEYAGKYSVDRPSPAIYRTYLDTLLIFVTWLLDRNYDVRLLVGDTCDSAVVQELKQMLNERLSRDDAERVFDEPAASVEDLLLQLAATEIVVATRFHNVLAALLLNKPVISISFHHKCASLMSQMGLAEYCQDMNDLKAAKLIEQFRQLEKNVGSLRPLIRQKAAAFRRVLDDQYNFIFQDFEPQ